MIGGILLLAIAIFGILIMFGKARLEQFWKFVIFLILAPVLLGIGVNHVLWYWSGLPVWGQILCIIMLPFFFSVLLRILFPRAKWIQTLQTIIFDTLVFVITFPFRFAWRAGRFFRERERPAQRLNPYRPVVGARPPTENERRETNRRRNIFD